MNYIVIFIQIFVLFYMVYMYHETYQKHYHTEANCMNRYAIAFLISCLIFLFVPERYFVFLYYGILIILPVFMYYKEEGYGAQLCSYFAIVLITTLIMLGMHYITSVVPTLSWPFHFTIDTMFCNVFIICSLLYLQYIHDLRKAPYINIIVCCILLLCGVDFTLSIYGKFEDGYMIGLLPQALTICMIGFFRMFYTMETSKDNVLELTIQRYADKENKERFIILEKENKMIMQQLHDMKKHLRMLDEIQQSQEELETYKKEIENKTDEMLYSKVSGNTMIDRILQTYRPRFQSASIQCNVEIDDVDYSFIDIIDMSALLSNLLDNAIESCLKCEDRFILLKMKKRTGFVVIKMKNSCMNILEEDGELKTTKEDSLYHGFGMRNIEIIASKYKGELKYHFEQEHHLFITTITLFSDRL